MEHMVVLEEKGGEKKTLSVENMNVNTKQVITAALYMAGLCELGNMPVCKEQLSTEQSSSTTKAGKAFNMRHNNSWEQNFKNPT